MKYIYLAGPLTHESAGYNMMDNVREAMNIYAMIIQMGYFPYCPHLSAFADIVTKIGYEQWMALDFAWLEKCDALVRIGGVSPGADREMKFAREHGIQVYTAKEFMEVHGETHKSEKEVD